jgi:hypothetical protein
MQELLIKGYARGDAATNSVELSQRLSMEENALFQVQTCIGKRVRICSGDVQTSVQPLIPCHVLQQFHLRAARRAGITSSCGCH